MNEALLNMASQQTFPVALLLVIAYILWKTFRTDMVKKDLKYEVLEGKFDALQCEFRNHIIDQQRKFMDMNAHTTVVLERNTAILEQLAPLVKTLSK